MRVHKLGGPLVTRNDLTLTITVAMKTKALVFLLTVLLLSYNVVHSEKFELSFDDFNATTVAGSLTIKKKVDVQDHVFLGEKMILQGDQGHYSWFVASAYPRYGQAKLILLGFDTGVNSCQFLYRVLEIRPNGGYLMSNDFGNCNEFEDPAFSIDQNTKRETARMGRDGWMISLPTTEGRKSVWYVYRHGKIYRDNKIVGKTQY